MGDHIHRKLIKLSAELLKIAAEIRAQHKKVAEQLERQKKLKQNGIQMKELIDQKDQEDKKSASHLRLINGGLSGHGLDSLEDSRPLVGGEGSEEAE